MFIGMIASIFVKNGRFQKLRKSLEKFVVLIIAIPIFFHSTNLQAERIQLEPLDTIFKFDKNHADNFGKLLVQDNAGRMKPLDSLNMELLHKIYRSSKVSGLNPNQVILGMLLKPELWKQINLIYTKDPKVNQLLGVDKNSKYVSFNDCFEDPQTLQGYKLASHVSEALRMPPKKRGKLEKALLKIDERINISYMVYSGSIFRIFPRPNDPSHRWENAITAIQNFNSETSSEVRDLLLNYFQSVDHALKNGNWKNADKAVQAIKNFQNKYGKDVLINQTRIEAEIIYNKLEIFKNLLPYTFLIGFILLIVGFVQIIKDIQFKKTVLIFKSLIFVIFTVFTAGMILRWYVSGHAPWSDAYESLLYIGWATLLAGLIFSRKSPLVLASTTILAGIILFVAHLNWLDPQITNLVPVLKSYWLTIHVSLITASYGFLGLGAVIGFIVLILFVLKNKKNSERFEKRIIELNTINEMNLLAGLVLLTIGNFLGGIWANESWGRYWGWDPKETWALVTILVYSAIIHIKYISKAQTHYNFALLSILGLSSVIMTYFGVNFYLSGMHSYAQGDPVPIPGFVYYTILTIVITAALAYRNRKMSQE
jgi:cytochrome c-type biogenesis protein CcsB